MTSPVWSYLFLGWVFIFPPAIAAGGLLMAARWWLRKWREAGVIVGEAEHAAGQVPYPTPAAYLDPVDASYRQARSMLDSCTWCKPEPSGLCSCERRCGHKRCVHVAGRGWRLDDREILEGKRLP